MSLVIAGGASPDRRGFELLQKGERYWRLVDEQFRDNPDNIATLAGLLDAYQAKRLNESQLYIMVYSLFHASNAHVLLSGFFVFLPQQWRGLDLEWLHAEIRDAQRDMKRWVELCRRWDLEPGLFPTADAARGLPAQQAITGTVQTRKDDGTLLLSRSGSHVRSNLPSASAIPALTVGKKVSENQGNSIIDGAGPQTFDGSRSTPPPHYQRNESAKTETSKVTASPRPDLNISTSPSQDIPSTPRFSPLTPPRNATAGSETSSPSSPLSPVPEAFNNPRGAPPPPFGNMSSFGLYTEDNFDDGVEPFRAPSRTRSRRKSRRTSNSAAASLETISFRRLTRSTRQVNADNTKTKGTLDGSPSLGNDSEPRPTKIESTVDNDTFDAALTLQSLTSETGAAVVTSESIKAQTPSKTPKSIINQPRANKRKTNNSLSDSVDLDQDFGFLSSPPGPQIVPNRRVSGVTSQTIRDENPGSPPSASDVAHVGPVYRTIRDILARESEPYVHAACGARYHHPDDVIIHHLRRDERACEHVLDKKIRWDIHPSCISMTEVKFAQVKEGFVVLDQESADKINAAIASGLSHGKSEGSKLGAKTKVESVKGDKEIRGKKTEAPN